MNEQEILDRLQKLEQENQTLKEKLNGYPTFENLCNYIQEWTFNELGQGIQKWVCFEFASILQHCIETNVDAKTEFKKLFEKYEQEDESRRLNS